MAVRPERLFVNRPPIVGGIAAALLLTLLPILSAPMARAADALPGAHRAATISAGRATPNVVVPGIGTRRGPAITHGSATRMAHGMRTVGAAEPSRVAAPVAKHGGGGLLSLHEGTLIFTILVFALLLVVLRAMAWKPMIAALKQREDTIRESIEAAQRAKTEAQRAAQELEARIAEVQRQGAEQIAQAKADALRVADSIRNQAQQEAAALKDRALRDIGSAKQQALSEINNRAGELGVAVARKILQREITPQDQGRLVEQLLGQVDSASLN